jgi:hypothetical protein
LHLTRIIRLHVGLGGSDAERGMLVEYNSGQHRRPCVSKLSGHGEVVRDRSGRK